MCLVDFLRRYVGLFCQLMTDLPQAYMTDLHTHTHTTGRERERERERKRERERERERERDIDR